MLIAAKEKSLQGIAQLLVQKGLIDKDLALSYQQQAIANQKSLCQYLIKQQLFTSRLLAQLISEYFGLPFYDLNDLEFESLPIHLLGEKLINRYKILPLFIQTEYLFLATEDPSSQEGLKEIQFHTSLPLKLLIVESDKLQTLIEKLHFKNERAELDSLKINPAEERITEIISRPQDEEAPIIKWVNKILFEAIKKGSSDIHFEPYESDYRIRYRQDGLLVEVANPPLHLANRITARLKVMANLDISERRLPQDGHFKMEIATNQIIDLRINTCPTVNGEKVAIRILDPKAFKPEIKNLGFNSLQEEIFLANIEKPQGMILVTGPTGSGKSLSLYSALDYLNTKERNILTLEDPVEIRRRGINQVNVNLKTGLTFSNTLRAFLRQDPDIIMIGEIRDFETAEIALKAAQTGHLLLSTLHTNSAVETITRLRGMGLSLFNIASSLNLIVAQRLVRKLCPFCKKPADRSSSQTKEAHDLQEAVKNFQLFSAVGCERCTGGYQGRIGLFEVMSITPALSDIILSGANSIELLKQARQEGMLTIYESGLEKIQAGISTVEEISRVCNHF